MNKLYIVLGVVVLAVIGYLMFAGTTIDYVTTVNDEVAALETELAEIEAAVAAGTMTPEQAAEAQVRIVTRLDAINAAVEGSGKAKLTEQQRVTLVNGLASLQATLTKYRATLVTVEDKVMELPEADRPTLNRGKNNSKNRTLASVLTETAVAVEELGADIEDNIAEEISDVADDVTASASTTTEVSGDNTENEMDTEVSEDTDESDTEEESVDEDEMDSEETDESMDEGEDFGFGTEVETETTATATAQ